MVWDVKKELEKKKKEHPEAKSFVVDYHNERIETQKEYWQRMKERNTGIFSGLVLGALLGIGASLLIDSVQKLFFQFDSILELPIGIALITLAIWAFRLMLRGSMEFYTDTKKRW